MNCKYCGLALPEAPTRRRQREYCNDAHKQKDYRRRHAAGTEQELETARQRIAELERQVTELQLSLDLKEQELEKLRQQSQPVAQVKEQSAVPEENEDLVPLVRFAGDHFVNRGEAERLCRTGMIRYRKVPKGTRQVIMLDALGRRDFWIQFHSSGDFRSCDDCPHGKP